MHIYRTSIQLSGDYLWKIVMGKCANVYNFHVLRLNHGPAGALSHLE